MAVQSGTGKASNLSSISDINVMTIDGVNYLPVLTLVGDRWTVNFDDAAMTYPIECTIGVHGKNPVKESVQESNDVSTAINVVINQIGTTFTGSTATITITDQNAPAGRRYDLFINDVDQGVSQTSTSFNVTGLPTDGSTVTLRVMISDDNAVTFTVGAVGTATAFTASTSSNHPSLIAPANGSTITSNNLTLQYTAGSNAPVDRKYDIHGSLSAQPTTDTPSSGYGNDVFDSVGIGSVLTWTMPGTLSQGVYTIYGRIRYTDNNFEDNDTTIAEGRFYDFTLQVNIAVTNTGHLANLLDLDAHPLVPIGTWDQQDWEDLFGLNASYTPTNSSIVSLVNDNGVRKIRQEHIPTSSGTANVIAPMRFTPDDSGTYKRVRVRQRIGLPANWTFGTTSFGGKLGMYIGGGVNTAGGLVDPAGTTLRPSFAHDYATGKNYLSMYDYAADRDGTSGTYGENTYSNIELFAGQDFLLEYEAQMNSIYASSDGWYKAWVDGVLVLDVQNIGWMTQARLSDTEPKWNRIGRSQKHGGNTAARSPTSSTHAFNWDISWQGYN